MIEYLSFVAMVLLLTLLGGLERVLLGPGTADRMLAAQLFGTVGVAILVVLAVIHEQNALLDVALILTLLAPLALLEFVRLAVGKR